MSDEITVTFLSDRAFLEQLKSDSAIGEGKIRIAREQEERDPTTLQFGLTDAASIVAIVSGVLYTGELAVRVYRWMKASGSKRLIVQVPLGTIEVFPSHTESEIRERLLRARGE